MSWQPLVGAIAGVVVLWAVLVATLWVLTRREDDPARLRDLLRLLPDVVRLLRRLLADRTLPRGVRVRVGLVVVYLLVPVDLVPDFLPVVGYADDALVVALVLRSVVRVAGLDAVERHWPGTPDGLRALVRLVGIGR